MGAMEWVGIIGAFLTLQGSILGGAWKMGKELQGLVTRITVLESQVTDLRMKPSGEHALDLPPQRKKARSYPR